MLGAAWICAVGLWGIMEGMLMTHEDSKILRTMTMMKTDDSNDSHDSNNSNESNEIITIMIPP